MPLLAGVRSGAPLGPLDLLGAAVALAGLATEAIADRQLRRFRADPGNRGRVLDSGLWRYSRHPNYFGDEEVTPRLRRVRGAYLGLRAPAPEELSGPEPWTARGRSWPLGL